MTDKEKAQANETVKEAIEAVYATQKIVDPEPAGELELSDLIAVSSIPLNAVRAKRRWPIREAVIRAIKRGKKIGIPLFDLPWGKARCHLELAESGQKIAGHRTFRTKRHALRFFAGLKAASRIAVRRHQNADQPLPA